MADQDFSHRTVAQKLGINPGNQITVINSPENYLNLIDSPNISTTYNLQPKTSFIHYFAHSKSALENDFPNLKSSLAKNGILWISNKKNQPDFNKQFFKLCLSKRCSKNWFGKWFSGHQSGINK